MNTSVVDFDVKGQGSIIAFRSLSTWKNTEKRNDSGAEYARRETFQDLIDNNLLTSHFQPIISVQHGKVFAYEALCRTINENPYDNIEDMFQDASKNDGTLKLDMHCRKNALECAAQQGIQQYDAKLFLNICPSSLLHPAHNAGNTEKIAKQNGISKEKIVLEITEQDAVHNYSLFRKAIEHYRSSGFLIAIDDFGAGYGGLKMLSMIEPDYVKIDRHFFKDHCKSNINYNLIEAIATACHRIGIEVIAEGIETEKDFKMCMEVGIDLLQGYYFARPSKHLCPDCCLNFPDQRAPYNSGTKMFDEIICVGDIVRYEQPVAIDSRVLDVLNRFQCSSELHCLPVHDKGRLCGLVNRQRFMETHMVGRFGYGMNLNHFKSVSDVMEDSYLEVPHYSSIEEVSRKIHLRHHVSIYDDVCVTRNGRYLGIVAVSDILNAMTENSMMLARGANPLTGLPGNEFIQRQIAKMLSQSIHFDVCYIDIDNFKAFNDLHGFEVGDRVIKSLSDIMLAGVKKMESSPYGFAGHIGGDDFIIISRPKNSIAICEYIIQMFEKLRKTFHTTIECEENCYSSVDREGKERKFHLLSLSVGIVSTEIHHISSFAEISSIAKDLKKRAKDVGGSSIIRDRRTTKYR